MLELKYEASFFESPLLMAAAILAVMSSWTTVMDVSPKHAVFIVPAKVCKENKQKTAMVKKYFIMFNFDEGNNKN